MVGHGPDGQDTSAQSTYDQSSTVTVAREREPTSSSRPGTGVSDCDRVRHPLTASLSMRLTALSIVLACAGILTLSAQTRNAPASSRLGQDDPMGLGIRWARIPAGTFQMGCVPNDDECDKDEKPQHAVTLTRDYWLMTTEVTLGMFRAYSSLGHPMPLQADYNVNPRQPIQS